MITPIRACCFISLSSIFKSNLYKTFMTLFDLHKKYIPGAMHYLLCTLKLCILCRFSDTQCKKLKASPPPKTCWVTLMQVWTLGNQVTLFLSLACVQTPVRPISLPVYCSYICQLQVKLDYFGMLCLILTVNPIGMAPKAHPVKLATCDISTHLYYS